MSIDEAFQATIASFPVELRVAAQGLPSLLGIGSNQDAHWVDYSKLLPMTDLPQFALPLLRSPLPQEQYAQFLDAHRKAGFWGVAVDRVLDGQVSQTETLERVIKALEEAWVDCLGRALGDRSRAARAVAEASEQLHEGCSLEHQCLELGEFTVETYVRSLSGRVRFLATPTLEMLRSHACPAACADFMHVFERLMLVQQLLDDAVDAEQDRALRGKSAPDLMAFSPRSFAVAASLLARSSAQHAVDAGLHELAQWLRERGAQAQQLKTSEGDTMDDDTLAVLGGLVLAEGLEGQMQRGSMD